MATDAEIIDAIAAIGLDVAGINPQAVYGPGTDYGQALGVRELPDDISVALPAFVALMGAVSVIGGPAERQTWALECSVWTGFSPRGVRYRELLELRPLVHAAFRAKAKAGTPDAVLQIVQITELGAIEIRRWTNAEQGTPFLVLPITLEAKVNRLGTLTPA
jgi:hypothetical protein